MSSLSSILFLAAVCSSLLHVYAKRMEIDRNEIISAAIETVKEEFATMEKEKYSNSQSKLRAFKTPTPETLAQGNANLKFENMVKLSERNILRRQYQATVQTESSLAEAIAMELLHTPGSILSENEIARIYQESGCLDVVEPPKDCNDGKGIHRSDGTCNNFVNPTWGAAATPLRRLIPARYDDGVSRGRGFLQSQGSALFQGPFKSPNPSPRIASTTIIRSKNSEDDTHSHLLMQWGQFVDHDITAVPEHETCPKSCEVSSDNEGHCYPFLVPEDDNEVEVTLADSKKCHAFHRSLGACLSPSHLGQVVPPREQLNSITHFIDGSSIYGFSADVLNMIRDLSSEAGLLRIGPPANVGSQRPLLPNAPAGSFILCQNSPQPCFLAGDKRCNEQSALTIMHTIWLREHNRIAQYIKDHDRSLSSEEVFQTARKIVISELQKITYKDYLPIILGDAFSSLIPDYTGYKKNVNPSIPNAFATAAFRFGHSQIRHTFERLDENYAPSSAGPLSLVDSFFDTSHVHEYGTDSILRGQLSKPMLQVDEFMDDSLTNRLFADNINTPGIDLASLNIQRGRDHGLPKYITWKQWAKRQCGVESDFQHPITMARILGVYGDLSNADLFVGGLAEKPLPNAKVGATFACIIAKTFAALRDGDRFFYENTDSEASPLSVMQRQEINSKVSLSRVICDNTDIKKVQLNAFLTGQARVPCSQIPQVNLDLWSGIQASPQPPTSQPTSTVKLPNVCYIKVRTSQEGQYLTTSRRVGEYRRDYLKLDLSSDSETCIRIKCPKRDTETVFAVGSITQGDCAPKVNSHLPESLDHVPRYVLSVFPTPSIYIQQFDASRFLQGTNGLFTSRATCRSSTSIGLNYDCVQGMNTDKNFVQSLVAKISQLVDNDSETRLKTQLLSLSQNEEKLVSLMEETLQQLKSFDKTEEDLDKVVSQTSEGINDSLLASKLEKIMEQLD